MFVVEIEAGVRVQRLPSKKSLGIAKQSPVSTNTQLEPELALGHFDQRRRMELCSHRILQSLGDKAQHDRKKAQAESLVDAKIVFLSRPQSNSVVRVRAKLWR